MIGIVLLSGGIDSATTTAIAKEECQKVIGVHYNYDQQTEKKEEKKAKELARELDIKLITKDLGKIFENFRSGTMIDKKYEEKDLSDDFGQSIGYVHMRNLLFLTIAAAITDSQYKGKEVTLYIGAQRNDRENYPDCREEFIQSAKKAIDKSTEKNDFKIRAPLLEKTKKEVIESAKNYGVNLDNTFSCYNSINGEPCGSCPACKERKEALRTIEEAKNK